MKTVLPEKRQAPSNSSRLPDRSSSWVLIGFGSALSIGGNYYPSHAEESDYELHAAGDLVWSAWEDVEEELKRAVGAAFRENGG